MKLFKSLLTGTFFLATVCSLFLFYKFQTFSAVTTEEVFRDDERSQIQYAAESINEIQEENRVDYVTRGAHAKAHGCVKAFFNVLADIRGDLKHGVFKEPGKSFKAWVRFSNAHFSLSESQDNNNDARGMAVKLISPQENQWITGKHASETQDFLMHNHPVFFTSNMQDYNHFLASEDKLKHFLQGYNPFEWKLREFKQVLDTLKPPPLTPLRTTYFSNTAYKLGPHNIKFSASACDDLSDSEWNDSEYDFLQHRLQQEINSGNACMKFRVQLQDPEKNMPIEDPSVLWKESDSAFITIAHITFPEQDFSSPEQKEFCENLSFSPWNALPEHRPIGELNRMRKKVYASSSSYRHEQNNAEVSERLDW